MTRIGVLGPGGVGGVLAARLGAAGHQVSVLATERTAAEITLRGLHLTAPDGETVTAPVARPWLTAPVDLLIVAVKATDLLPALARVPAPALGAATIVPLLNGIDHPALLRAAYPEASVVPASIAIEATRHRAGVVEQLTTMADLVVADDTPAGVAAAELFGAAGLAVSTQPDEATVLWRKMAFLAPLALLTTATDAPIGPARDQYPDRLRALVDETAAAAGLAGVRIEPDRIVARLAALPPTMQSSMLKDRRSGRTLELDAIAGPIVRALGAERAAATVEVGRQILAAG
ncbi:putative 2-dehydropantoate 2-reductase [Actinocatenispora thailandica]|uniref:2-dehydropantoate 2-reductase n=1 Tax=Actinocatenispora thailandica TaxID=227318 RepID=A0A7R7DPK6_9ACTN|nr:2-dehydropantoate 2-reductase [Actinocatenispora thailandica]BCJ35458.1 putative 2-dehydropantoate 2-reductase [Actinocatenispora thailandica]